MSMLAVNLGAATCRLVPATIPNSPAILNSTPPPTSASAGPATTVSTQVWLRDGPQSFSASNVTTCRTCPPPRPPDTNGRSPPDPKNQDAFPNSANAQLAGL